MIYNKMHYYSLFSIFAEWFLANIYVFFEVGELKVAELHEYFPDHSGSA